MVGLDVMRGAAGVAATLKQRTWQLEHAEDWAGALEVCTTLLFRAVCGDGGGDGGGGGGRRSTVASDSECCLLSSFCGICTTYLS